MGMYCSERCAQEDLKVSEGEAEQKGAHKAYTVVTNVLFKSLLRDLIRK